MQRTQVGIIGAGPAGLMLSQLLHLNGISSVVLESKSRDYVESRVRAGVLEHNTVETLKEAGAGDRMEKEGIRHDGVILSFNGRRHRVAFPELTDGRTIMIYGQREVVKDLIRIRLQAGGDIRFEAPVESIGRIDTDKPVIYYQSDGEIQQLQCDFVAGCDGFHGISRVMIPQGSYKVYGVEYPFCWLGILAQVAPSSDELIYAYHERGFALHSYRSPTVSRLYIQVDPDDHLDNWPDDRIWEELKIRLSAEGWMLQDGPILEKGITTVRSFMIDRMQHARLFLAGDAAHIVPPTGAKGLNLAIADVKILAKALTLWYESNSTRLLHTYSDDCLRRVWRVQDFSNFMTSLFHKQAQYGTFEYYLQKSKFDYVVHSKAMATTIAENYVGLEKI